MRPVRKLTQLKGILREAEKSSRELVKEIRDEWDKKLEGYTATRDLKNMVNKGIIQMCGVGRGIYYVLNDSQNDSENSKLVGENQYLRMPIEF